MTLFAFRDPHERALLRLGFMDVDEWWVTFAAADTQIAQYFI
jgi:hypothetical protein